MNRTKFLVIDTETCDLVLNQSDKVDPTNTLVYNVGWAVVDKYGETYVKRNFIVAETMFGMRKNMRQAFYASKIPQYWDMVARGTCEVKSFWEIREILLADLATFAPRAICAHNARFDVTALNNTLRTMSETRFTRYFPEDVPVWDTMKYAHDVIAIQPTYQKFCEDNGFMTKHSTPRPRLTAEVLYRYITHNTEFEEEHTALSDVMIEAVILQKCIAQHKKADPEL